MSALVGSELFIRAEQARISVHQHPENKIVLAIAYKLDLSGTIIDRWQEHAEVYLSSDETAALSSLLNFALNNVNSGA